MSKNQEKLAPTVQNLYKDLAILEYSASCASWIFSNLRVFNAGLKSDLGCLPFFALAAARPTRAKTACLPQPTGASFLSIRP